MEEQKQNKHWHNPEKLFCHYKFSQGKCDQKQCKFKHELFQSKHNTNVLPKICPNGIKCPINHKKLKCPIEEKEGSCQRKTIILRKTFKCEYKHKNQQSQQNEQKQQKKKQYQNDLKKNARKAIITDSEEDEEQIQEKNNEKMETEEGDEEEKNYKLDPEEQKVQQELDKELEEIQAQIKREPKNSDKNLEILDNLNKKFKIYQVPRVTKGKTSTVIGVLDQSGSMCSCWKYLARQWNQISQEQETITVTFHNKAQLQNKPLVENPEWGGTEIEKGFQLINEILKKDDLSEEITIIFVSDGADNNSSTIKERMAKYTDFIKEKIHGKRSKKINMINVAVGAGFPTFLAMQIRETYHNGDDTIPSVFLIEQTCNEDEWQKTFEKLKTNLNHKNDILIDQPVSVFPWDSPSNQIAEDGFVFVEQKENSIEEESSQISIKNSDQKLTEVKEFTLQNLTKIGSTLLNFIQVKSLQKNYNLSLLKLQSKQAYEIMLSLLNQYQKNQSKNDYNKKLTFKQKLENKQKTALLESIVASLKESSQTNILANLSEEEAAKRLAIGTVQGKYHQKALEMAGLDSYKYNQILRSFIDDLKDAIKNKKIQQNKDNQSASFMTLQNQREAFLEEDFIEGLEMVKNQYEMVEIFPLIGQSLFIRRTDGSMINPYLISVQDVPRHHNTVDVNSIIQSNNVIEVSIGNDELEKINAVLPLFDEQDEDLAFFYKSELFQFLMTFNLCNNADTLLAQSYKALLVNSLVNVMNQKDSEWKTQMIKKMLTSYKVMFESQQSFKNFTTLLQQDPYLAVQPEINEELATKSSKLFAKDMKCEDLSLALAHLMYLREYELENFKKVDMEQFQKAFALELYGRFVQKDRVITDQFHFENQEEIIKLIQESLSPTTILYSDEKFNPAKLLKNFHHLYELNNSLDKKLNSIKVAQPEGLIIRFNKKVLSQGKLNQKSVDTICSQISPDLNLQPINNLEIFNYVYAFTTSSERYLNLGKLLDQEKVQSQLTAKKFNSLVIEQKKHIFKQVFTELKTHYKNLFQQAHQGQPNLEKITGYLSENPDQQQQYKLNDSKLPINACGFENCPHYMELNNSNPQHLQPYLRIHSFNKACRLTANQDKLSDEQVLLEILAGTYNKGGQKQKFSKKEQDQLENTQAYLVQHIKELRAYYKNLQE
ncbi:hypothetical protein PPERSA_00787 [Pseudocohnilembus persalinus]|uniref:Uncharacterized protein n=1 Tax=Pseudocohnilembus persalinus TaxID=266149 RepID=A0A0V0Q9V7_PSEPJ|nr:hypothetical protein PPERSA_00787 [Pseudocohnilembus persalinus]|eukprot:KRW98960.1 hypothetical protein PPERSA_00787 [Pseudocohnilembus persalinus]